VFLGACFFEGFGLEEDKDEAFNWF
jgi:TPR repeat protein